MIRKYKLLFLFFILLLLITGFFTFYLNIINKDKNSKEHPKADQSLSNNVIFENITSGNSITDETLSISANTDDVFEASNNTVSKITYPYTDNQRFYYQEHFYIEPLNEATIKRIQGLSYKDDCTVPFEELRYLSLYYVTNDQKVKTGELICNQAIAEDLIEIFYELYQNNYPIEQISLIDKYQADDDLSCIANNTSCFNFRKIANSDTLSNHAFGLAVDINPLYNPYVSTSNGVMTASLSESLPYIDRAIDFPYKIEKDDLCYQLFLEHGFTWGGDWKNSKDYQHFEKKVRN